MAELKPFEDIMRFTPKLDNTKATTVNWEVEHVRELVRCKDCEHYKPYYEQFDFCKTRGDGYCTIPRLTDFGQLDMRCTDDFFCADGERREE